MGTGVFLSFFGGGVGDVFVFQRARALEMYSPIIEILPHRVVSVLLDLFMLKGGGSGYDIEVFNFVKVTDKITEFPFN